jgi:hypothetical protein
MVPESKLEKTEHGLVPKGEGWFVLNMVMPNGVTSTGAAR